MRERYLRLTCNAHENDGDYVQLFCLLLSVAQRTARLNLKNYQVSFVPPRTRSRDLIDLLILDKIENEKKKREGEKLTKSWMATVVIKAQKRMTPIVSILVRP